MLRRRSAVWAESCQGGGPNSLRVRRNSGLRWEVGMILNLRVAGFYDVGGVKNRHCEPIGRHRYCDSFGQPVIMAALVRLHSAEFGL